MIAVATLTMPSTPAAAAPAQPNVGGGPPYFVSWSSTTCADGSTMRAARITAGTVKPHTLTDDQLAGYGYPRRPKLTDAKQMRTWTNFVDNVGPTSPPVCSTKRGTRGSIRHGAALNAGSVNGSLSSNWAGNVAINGTYSYASGSWTVPVAAADPSDQAYSSTWVGIGSGNAANTPLAQSGSHSDTALGVQSYYLWTEVFPEQQEQYASSSQTQPGDLVYSEITYTTTQLTITVLDETLGSGGTEVYTGSFLPAGQAEFITERPSYTSGDGSFTTLFHYPQMNVNFTNSIVDYGGGNTSLSTAPHDYSVMTTCDQSAAIVQPLGIGSDGQSFTTQWLQYGDVCNTPN